MIFLRCYQNSKWPPEVNNKKFVGAKTLKLKLKKCSNFTRKNSKNEFGQFFLNFNITFLATCGCAIDFLKMLPKFKMAARSQLQIFLRAQKIKIKRLKLFKFDYHIPHHMEI